MPVGWEATQLFNVQPTLSVPASMVVGPNGDLFFTETVGAWTFPLFITIAFVALFSGYYAVAPMDDPTGPPSGGFRSVHGGSAEMDDANEFRAAKRTIRDPDTTDWDLGFRCARTP